MYAEIQAHPKYDLYAKTHSLFSIPELQLKKQGFTLIEMMVVVSLLLIIGAQAVPSMSESLSKVRQRGHLSTVMNFLQLARTEAIFQNKTMIMCKSKDQKKCDSNADWSDGWIIFSDKNKDHQLNDGEKMIFSHARLVNQSKIMYKSFSGGEDYVKFYSEGYSHTNGTFIFCNRYGIENTRTIVISRSGRIRAEDKPSVGIQRKCQPFSKKV